MSTQAAPSAESRTPLSRARILRAAIDVADEGGIESLTMRKVGQQLGVEAMSLYNHVANKDDILDGIADVVSGEFIVPSPEADWIPAMRQSAISAHEALLRHPWACGLIESRANAGPARLRYLDSVIGLLRAAGFSLRMALHAIMVIDSHIYGFTLQELNSPFDREEIPEAAADFVREFPDDEHPNIVEMAGMFVEADPDMEAEFEFGLDLIFDGLERIRTSA